MNLVCYLFLSILLLLNNNIAQAQKKPTDCSLEDIESLLETFNQEEAYDKFIPYAKAGAEKAAKKFDKQDTTYAKMLYFIGIGYYAQEDFSNAEKYLKQAIEIQKIKTPISPQYALSLENLGHLYFGMGNYALAEPLWKELGQIRKKLLGEKHLYYVDNLHNLALLYYNMGDYASAEPLYKELLELQKEILGEKDEKYILNLNIAAYLHWALKKYDLAESLYQKLIVLQKETLGEKHPNYAETLYNLALLYESIERYTDAEPLYKTTIPIRKEILGEKHPDYASSLASLGVLYIKMGNNALAEPLLKEALQIRKEVLGKNHTDYATSSNDLGVLYMAMGNYTLAESFYKEAIQVRKEVLGENNLDYANSLNNLAMLYNETNDYTLAEPLLKEVLIIQKEILGEKHPDYASSLNDLARLYSQLGNYTLAVSFCTESIEIQKEILGEQHPDYANGLNNLAILYMSMANYALAESLFKEALNITKEFFGEKHPEYAASLNNLAMLYDDMGNDVLAESLHKEALKIRKEALDEKHPDYAQSLNNLAMVYDDNGNYTQAESLYKEALEIRKKVFGEKHPDYASSLNNLGLLYMNTGNNALAESLFKEALQIQKEILGEKHSDYASTLNNLACLYNLIGNYVLAESLYKEAIQIKEKTFGEKHPDYASGLNNLAMVYDEIGNDLLAEPLYKEALQIRKEILGEKHPEYAASLNNLAKFYHKIGNNTLAEPLLKEALQIRKEVLGEKHPEYANSLNALAVLYNDNDVLAEPLFKEAIKIQKEVLGEKHPVYAISLNNLAILYIKKGVYNKAIPLYTEALNINKNNLSKNFAWLSEKGKNAYWQKNKNFYQGLNNFAALAANELPEAAELAYQGNLLSKALLLETSKELEEAIAKSKDASTIQVYSELKKKRSQHAHLRSSGLTKKGILDRMEHEADSLDKILVGRMGEYAVAKRKFEISWKEVQTGLKAKEAAIEFARYYDEKDKQIYFLALVLRLGDVYPQVVKLGKQDEIADIPAGKGFANLYKLIWQPIDSLLVGMETIYYSPNGYLNNISFAGLCSKGKETNCTYLSDRYTLYQLSTTRYLAEGLKHSKIEPSVLIFGGVDYETIPTNTNNLSSSNNENNALLENISRNSSNQSRMLYLPNTQTELQNLQEILNSNKWNVRTHSDNNASENTLKTEIKKESPSVLHIATHGFAFPDLKEKNINLLALDDRKAYQDADNPMVRCGLLFAGANHSWTGNAKTMLTNTGEDGILTALEVSALPLKNTKLVVLSACETGLGKIDGAEGTFGLKRGFKLAGVEQIIVSLWSVPDKETMELMSLFYEDLAKTHDAVISFDKAQKIMRNKYSDRPDLWAGFVLVR